VPYSQHFDDRLSKVFFEELEIPEPDFYLGIGSGTHAGQTARIMMRLSRFLRLRA
jgi:UDP-N-acetylglucosamine 2-epimerase (non-hydrolysing)